MWDIIFFCLLTGVIVSPFLPAILEWRNLDDATPLPNVESYDAYGHRFAHSFKRYMAQELDLAFLSDEYLQVLPGDKLKSSSINKVLIVPYGLHLDGHRSYKREIFAKDDVTICGHSEVYAVLAHNSLCFGAHTRIIRWAHAEEIVLGHHCISSGRLTAEKSITLAPTCKFSRLQAQTIIFGTLQFDLSGLPGKKIDPELENHLTLDDVPPTVDVAGRWIVDTDLRIPSGSVVDANIIVRGHCWIEDNVYIAGSIKTKGALITGEGCHITGSTVSEGHIVLGKKNNVGGPVLSERTVDLGSSSLIGSIDRATTVAAKKIVAGYGVVVHGSMHARHPS